MGPACLCISPARRARQARATAAPPCHDLTEPGHGPFVTRDGFFMHSTSSPAWPWAVRSFLPWAGALLLFLVFTGLAEAHGVAEGDKGYIKEITGVHILPFVYLGAKHMVTGYDHLLFLLGVIFFLYRLEHITTYVTLFAIGHSTTMLAGVFFNIAMSS
jgi:hypothetical protein